MKSNLLILMKIMTRSSFLLILTTLGLSHPSFANQNSETQGSKPSTEATSENNSDSDRIPTPTGRYVTGGVIGSIFGFGIGHAIQDRYSGLGLTFTLVESAGLLLTLSGVNQCDLKKNDMDFSSRTKCSDSASSQILLGYGLFLGFHIWEVVDLWTGATPVNDSPKSALMILPYKDDGAQFNFTYLF